MKVWLDKGEIQQVVVSNKDLEGLLNIVERDLQDSRVVEVSVDRRYANAYGAALNLASYVIRREGFRVVGKRGHHRTTFLVAEKILGSRFKDLAEYFDFCRRKRNQVDYDFVNVVSETEVNELIEQVENFKILVGI